MTAFIAKPFIGIRRDRAQEKKEYDAQLAEAATFLDDDRVAFVAIDSSGSTAIRCSTSRCSSASACSIRS